MATFTNVYYRRTAGTEKACYICVKPTATVLATINTADFLYTCPVHLTDPGFATLISNEGEKTAVSPEEIAKVKVEWEEKQKQKEKLAKEKEKEKDKEKDDKDKDKEKEKEKEKESDKKESKKEDSKSPKPPGTLPTSPPPSSTPTHQRYALHRGVFSMRQDEHRKWRQASQAKALAPRLPGAPKGGL